jgi:hypothetical protein
MARLASSSIVVLFSLVFGLAGCSNKITTAIQCSTLSDLGPCVPDPTVLAQRTACDGITSYCDKIGTQAPSLACLEAPPLPEPPMPPTVTLQGFVHALESGPDTSNITVQVIDPNLLVNGANPAFVQTIGGHTTTLDGNMACSATVACPSEQSCLGNRCWTRTGGVEPLQRACDVDPQLGCVLALTDGCNHSCNDGLDGRRDDGKYCRDDGHGGTCRERLRWDAAYNITNVPLNRALVVRIVGPGGVANTSWVQVIVWNLRFSSTARTCNGDGDSNCFKQGDPTVYQLDLETMAQADWIRLAQQSGLISGVPNGAGAILGEVHDCDDVRVSNVSVAVRPSAALISYFQGDPLTLKPDVSRALVGTDPLGRFAAWGVPAGRVTIDSAGRAATLVPIGDGGAGDDGGVVVRDETRSFGRDDVFVYDGTLSVVTVNGGRR